VDDLLKRMGNVESAVSDIRVQVGSIQTTLQDSLPNLVTKAELGKCEAAIQAVHLLLPHLATKNDVSKSEAAIQAVHVLLPHLATKNDVSKSESSIIKWLITTQIAVAALVLAIMRFFV